MNRVDIGLKVNAESGGFENLREDLQAVTEGFSDINGIVHEGTKNLEDYNEAVSSMLKNGTPVSSIPTIGEYARGGGGGGAFNPLPGGGSGGGVNDEGQDDGGSKNGRRVIPFPTDFMRLERSLKGAIGGLSHDAGGATVQAAEGIAGQIGALWGKLPLAAKIAGGAGIAIAGTMAIGNELSKQYEAVIPQVMSASTALGRFGETAKEQSTLFRSTMSEISGVSAKYGFTLQQGAAVVEALARGGTRGNTAMRGAGSVLAFSKGYGFTNAQSEFTDLYASAARYGMDGDAALAYAAGGARKTVGNARATEYAGAMTQMLEDGLSEGIVKGFDEISASQNFLYSIFGERAGGQRGADLYSSLSSSVRGATGLQSETDLLLYEATRKNMAAGSTPTDILMQMEGGFNVNTFQSFMENMNSRGATDEEKRFLISKAFGVSLTQASALLNAKTDSDINYAVKGSVPGASIYGTTESELTGHQEDITDIVRSAGAGAADIKNQVLSGVDAIGKLLTGETTLADMLNVSTNTATINANDLKIIQNTRDLEEKRKTDKTVEQYDVGYGEVVESLRAKLDYVYGDLLYSSGLKNKGDDAKSLNKLLYDQKNWATILNVGETKRQEILGLNNLEKGDWTPKELTAAFKMLTQILNENTAATRENSKSQVTATVTVPVTTTRTNPRGH